MKTIKYLVIAIIGIVIIGALSGCGAFSSRNEPIVKTKIVTPEDSQLVGCDVTEPPAKDVFIAATADKEEELLQKNSASLYGDLATCNTRWKNLREWKVKQKALQTAE